MFSVLSVFDVLLTGVKLAPLSIFFILGPLVQVGGLAKYYTTPPL